MLALILALAVFLALEEGTPEPAGRTIAREVPLTSFAPANVSRLSVSTDRFTLECVRRGGEWRVLVPREGRADEGQIKRLLSALAKVRRIETISPDRQRDRGLTLAGFGLEPPRARVIVGNETQADDILLGDDAPLGGLSYVRLNGAPEVIGVTRELTEALPDDPGGFRDRAVFPRAIQKANRLEIKHPRGFVQLAYRGSGWRILQPFEARADGQQVERILQSLAALKVADAGSLALASDPVICGLSADEAALQVTVWPEGAAEGLTLTVGKQVQATSPLLYATVTDVAGVFTVADPILNLQSLKADALRDRRLCAIAPESVGFILIREGDARLALERTGDEGWMIAEPFRYAADPRAVGSLLKIVCETPADGIRSGLATNPVPAEVAALSLRLVLTERTAVRGVTNEPPVSVTSPPRTWSFRFDRPSPQEMIVFHEEGRTLYRVEGARALRWFTAVKGSEDGSVGNPLPFIDLRMLALVPGSLRQVTLSHDGLEETLTADGEGGWTVESPPASRMREGGLASLLAVAADLRADRIENVAATNRAAFGIDEQSARLTFGLKGESGLQKTVLLGKPDGRGGVFAMLQGQDVVFVLGNATADALRRSLIQSP
jgi:hypothetical protein